MNKQEVSKLVLSGAFAALTAVIVTADIFNGAFTAPNTFTSAAHMSENMINNVTFEDLFMNMSGMFSELIDMNSYYNNIGIYVTEDKYIISPGDKTDTDYEVRMMTELKEYLDEKGISLIYVNQPTKYIDDDIFRELFGKESFSNRNADLFLKRISEAGIDCIDLRDELVKDGKNITGYVLPHGSSLDCGNRSVGSREDRACTERICGL